MESRWSGSRTSHAPCSWAPQTALGGMAASRISAAISSSAGWMARTNAGVSSKRGSHLPTSSPGKGTRKHCVRNPQGHQQGREKVLDLADAWRSRSSHAATQ